MSKNILLYGPGNSILQPGNEALTGYWSFKSDSLRDR